MSWWVASGVGSLKLSKAPPSWTCTTLASYILRIRVKSLVANLQSGSKPLIGLHWLRKAKMLVRVSKDELGFFHFWRRSSCETTHSLVMSAGILPYTSRQRQTQAKDQTRDSASCQYSRLGRSIIASGDRSPRDVKAMVAVRRVPLDSMSSIWARSKSFRTPTLRTGSHIRFMKLMSPCSIPPFQST